jgi:hypothetical protein
MVRVPFGWFWGCCLMATGSSRRSVWCCAVLWATMLWEHSQQTGMQNSAVAVGQTYSKHKLRRDETQPTCVLCIVPAPWDGLCTASLNISGGLICIFGMPLCLPTCFLAHP